MLFILNITVAHPEPPVKFLDTDPPSAVPVEKAHYFVNVSAGSVVCVQPKVVQTLA